MVLCHSHLHLLGVCPVEAGMCVVCGVRHLGRERLRMEEDAVTRQLCQTRGACQPQPEWVLLAMNPFAFAERLSSTGFNRNIKLVDRCTKDMYF